MSQRLPNSNAKLDEQSESQLAYGKLIGIQRIKDFDAAENALDLMCEDFFDTKFLENPEHLPLVLDDQRIYNFPI